MISDPSFLFDRDPGCSLFVPVRGNRERARAILEQAASWHGYRLDAEHGPTTPDDSDSAPELT